MKILFLFFVVFNSLTAGSLLSKVDFINAKGKSLAPEKGWVLLRSDEAMKVATPVTENQHWHYNNGLMQPSLLLVQPGTRITVESSSFRVPDFIFSDGRSVLRLDGRARTKSRTFLMPGDFRVELSSFPGTAGRLFVNYWTHIGQPDERGIFVLENMESGSYKVWLLHPDLSSFRELSLEISAEEITKAVLRFSESDRE